MTWALKLQAVLFPHAFPLSRRSIPCEQYDIFRRDIQDIFKKAKCCSTSGFVGKEARSCLSKGVIP